MIRARAEVLKPDDSEVSVTITMSLGDWRELVKHEPIAWPNGVFRTVITNVIARLTESHSEMMETTA